MTAFFFSAFQALDKLFKVLYSELVTYAYIQYVHVNTFTSDFNHNFLLKYVNEWIDDECSEDLITLKISQLIHSVIKLKV